eukprot:c3664_g1_i1 orf=191-3040(-)
MGLQCRLKHQLRTLYQLISPEGNRRIRTMGVQSEKNLFFALLQLLLLSPSLFYARDDGLGVDMDGPTQTMCEMSEMQALIRLKRSLKVEDGRWPIHTDPCSTWAEVKCENGHVVSLLISGLLPGVLGRRQPVFLMDALHGLPFLKNLNVSGYAIAGSIPSWFGELTELEVLDLSSTALQGSIPESFCSLSKLKILSLAQNNLSGFIPPACQHLISLTYLDLSSNRLTGPFPISLFNATGLVFLDLSSNLLTGGIPSNVGKLSKLRHLSLTGNFFKGRLPVGLLTLSNLNHLDLASNQFSGSLPSNFQNVSKLVSLSLADNHFNGNIPDDISNCVDLTYLNLSTNLFTGEPLSFLSTLQNLANVSLSYNSFTGNLPTSLFSLPSLHYLQLSHNLFYGPLPTIRKWPNVSVTLDISFNFLNGSIPRGYLLISVRKNCFANVPKQHSKHACLSFYKRSGLYLNGLVPPSALPQSNAIPLGVMQNRLYRTKRLAVILGGVAVGVLIIAFVGAIALCFKYEGPLLRIGKVDQVDAGRSYSEGAGVFSINLNALGEVFSLDQLLQATENFNPSHLIASGRSGDFYKGILDGGATVAVKRIQNSKVSKGFYLNELEIFGTASHTRLVSLLGYCLVVPDEKFLVYKYMPNGDLASTLQRKGGLCHGEDRLQPLDWITRMKIAIGVSEGLTYLHHECSPPIVHRNIKANSILLDSKFEVRLGSLGDACVQDGEQHPGLIARLLGLSQLSVQVDSGSSGASCAKDVYCFGKLLLELLSGKVGISNQSDPCRDLWVEWALFVINTRDKESISKLVDPSLIIDEDLLDEVWAVAIIAKACLNPKPSKRPNMRHILKALESPRKVTREENLNDNMVSRTSSHSSWNEALFWGCRNFSQNLVVSGTLREENACNHRHMGSTATMQMFSQNSENRHGSSDSIPDVTVRSNQCMQDTAIFPLNEV